MAKAKDTAKALGKFKGSSYAKPGDLSLVDPRKKLQELKSKTRCQASQACGQIGRWAGDNNCPQHKRIANFATSLAKPKVIKSQNDGMMLSSSDHDGITFMAIREESKERKPRKDPQQTQLVVFCK